MYYSQICKFDIANGPGIRTTLFISGCTHCCKNCFQPETWNFKYGKPFLENDYLELCDSLNNSLTTGLTILGGEPLEPENQIALVPLIRKIKEEFPDISIWVYTGDVFEDLLKDATRCTNDTIELFKMIDVLVEGPYIEELKDPNLKFRGSRNQRLIDMKKTMDDENNPSWKVILLED